MNNVMRSVVLGCCTIASGLAAHSQMGDTDKQFLMKASQSDFTEIKFSQLALQKASNSQVKAFAQKMVTDHQQLESDMKPFADKAGVTPVLELDSEHQQKYDTLSQLNGVDFDKVYMSGMAQDHHVALDLFTAEEKSPTADGTFKPIVKKGEKVVAMHTRMADKAVTKMSTMGTKS